MRVACLQHTAVAGRGVGGGGDCMRSRSKYRRTPLSLESECLRRYLGTPYNLFEWLSYLAIISVKPDLQVTWPLAYQSLSEQEVRSTSFKTLEPSKPQDSLIIV